MEFWAGTDFFNIPQRCLHCVKYQMDGSKLHFKQLVKKNTLRLEILFPYIQSILSRYTKTSYLQHIKKLHKCIDLARMSVVMAML